MESPKFKPMFDKLYLFIVAPSIAIMLPLTVWACFSSAIFALVVTVLCDILVLYFLITPCFGYVELLDDCVFIKFGFFLKRKINYSDIRKLEKERKFYADSMVALKCAFEHVNIKYARFDVISVSVRDNDAFVKELENRIKHSA